MTKPPPKQEPKREPMPFYYMMLSFIIVGIIAIAFGISDVETKISETNELLSYFQRIDTVKDGGNSTGCIPRKDGNIDCSFSGILQEVDPQSDPNLCKKWKTECHGMGLCDVTCELGAE